MIFNETASNDTVTSTDCDQSQGLEERHKAPCYQSNHSKSGQMLTPEEAAISAHSPEAEDAR